MEVTLQIRGTTTRGLIALIIGRAHYRTNVTLTYTYLPIYLGLFLAHSENCKRRLLASWCMCACLSVSVSVGPHRTTRLPMDGFSWNLIFEYLSKICRGNPRFIKIWQRQRILHTSTYVHLWYYLAEFFLEWAISQKEVVEKTEIYFMFSNFVLCNHVLYEMMWKNIVQPGRLQMTIRRMRTACWVPKAPNTHLGYITIIAFPLQ